MLAQNHLWSSHRPDGHAPISVMGDHCHEKGEFMISYRYMYMGMDGAIQAQNNATNSEIYTKYMISPQSMAMQMQMLGAMYAPTDFLTLMVMGNYTSNSMDLLARNGTNFTTNSKGFSDVSVQGLVKVFNIKGHSMHANLGLSVPSGSISQKDKTPMSESTLLAYPMQLGSGTIDPILGATYLGQLNHISWGAQAIYKYRIEKNNKDYALGDMVKITGWGAYKISNYVSTSIGLTYFNLGKIKGVDNELNPMMMPLNNAKLNSGRDQLNLGLGLNGYLPKGAFKDFRIATEIQKPVYQNVSGIQMKNEVSITLGVQYVLTH